MATQRRLSNCKRTTFLRRLAADRSGNVMAISAAAVIPMIGVVGGAVDASRLYLVKSRIQGACDAAVLAGRKAMTTNTYTDAARARANAMFSFNFQNADYGTTATSFTSSADAQGKLTGNASTNVPMTLMQVFGFTTRTLNATCSADVQVPNIDVVFVLDVTGSMNTTLSGQTQNKLASLKVAMKDFRTTMDTALAGNTRSQVRYGFVPYSQTVNVSSLFVENPDTSLGQLPRTHLANNMTVESRVANFNTPVESFVAEPGSAIVFDQVFNINNKDTTEPWKSVVTGGTNISNVDCRDYASNKSMSIGGINKNVHLWPDTSWPGGSGRGDSVFYQAQGSSNWVTTEPTGSDSYRRLTFARVSATWDDDEGADTDDYKNCRRRVSNERLVKQTRWRFTNWTYKPVENVDVSEYKNGNGLDFVTDITDRTRFLVDRRGEWTPIQLRQLADQTWLESETASWNGCMEERATTAATNFSPIPAAATDLDFLRGGTTEAMRWRPALHRLTYNRDQSAHETTTDNRPRAGMACPPIGIRNLNAMTRTEYDNYVDSLLAQGSTYHDIGMVWGLRLIAAQGMFSNRNLTGANGGQISRHIIFLTDGEPAPRDDTYSSYAMEAMSQRVRGGSGMSLLGRHNRRFQALCDAQRGSVSIWAIGFGTSITGRSQDENTTTGNLTTCADPGRVYAANNQTQLQDAFRNIAREVADLRLVQ